VESCSQAHSRENNTPVRKIFPLRALIAATGSLPDLPPDGRLST